MFIHAPIPVQFYVGWREIQIKNKIRLAELCGLYFTGEFNDGEPEFVGNEKCWSEFYRQINLT